YVTSSFILLRPPPTSTLFPYTTLFRSLKPNLTTAIEARLIARLQRADGHWATIDARPPQGHSLFTATATSARAVDLYMPEELRRSEEHTSELQSRRDLVCRLLLEKKNI